MNKDRILEDTYRRVTGAFFTPDIWVEEAHKMIAEQFGWTWKEEYVVWDCACGTANLTRGYKFKELYISTLDQSDINTIKDCGYNPEATIFQYDFLNEVGIDSCPEGLKKAFEEGKKVLFLINPPYGKASGHFAGGKGAEKGLGINQINKIMKDKKYGKISAQLYAQFMYKITMLKDDNKNISLGIFSKPSFLTSNFCQEFRKLILNNFIYKYGMLFSAGNFSDVSKAWGVSFSIWEDGRTTNNTFLCELKKKNDNYVIDVFSSKILYNVDKEFSANKWARKVERILKKIDSPLLSSYASVRQLGGGKLCEGSIGYMNCNSNSVMYNAEQTGLYSAPFSNSSSSKGYSPGFPFIPENFNKVVALFTARKSIKGNWINDKDEYLVPNTEHPDYEQWNNDCIIYSLFNNSSQQSSLRQIDYKGKKWDIVNNFFFMSNEEMKELADTNNYNLMYQDTKIYSEDRYVYTTLQETILSPDAQEILDMAKDLIRKSISLRKVYGEENEKYHLDSWDAGWAQLKPMFKEYFKEDYTVFVEKYKEFENRMRTGVYKFGFLKK